MTDSVDLHHLELGPVTLVCGALAEQSVDVLVNEANTYLQMGSGVSGALRKAGGIGIHKEAVTHAPQPTGRIVRTSAGTLAAQAIYHAVLVDFSNGKGMSGKVVTQIVGEVLALAEEDGFTSLAMPLFGSGGSGLGLEVALEAIVEGLEAAGREAGDGLPVSILVRDADEFAEAVAIAKSLHAGDGRRAAENQLAEDFLAELMSSMGDDLDFGDLDT